CARSLVDSPTSLVAKLAPTAADPRAVVPDRRALLGVGALVFVVGDAVAIGVGAPAAVTTLALAAADPLFASRPHRCALRGRAAQVLGVDHPIAVGSAGGTARGIIGDGSGRGRGPAAVRGDGGVDPRVDEVDARQHLGAAASTGVDGDDLVGAVGEHRAAAV